MTEEKQKIWDYLIQNCLGAENAKSVADIASACGYPSFGTNDDKFRAIITDMVKTNKKPIGSCHAGYFVIRTEDERQKAIQWVKRDSKVVALEEVELYQPDRKE